MSIKNNGYIFDLDETAEIQNDKKNSENSQCIQVDLIESIDQFNDLDTFIDTGIHSFIIKRKDLTDGFKKSAQAPVL